MNKATELAAAHERGPEPKRIRCVETGEVLTMTEWSESIGNARNVKPDSVRQTISKAINLGTQAYGLRFEVVQSDQENS